MKKNTKLFVRLMCLILAGLMIFSVAYYIFVLLI